MTVMTSSLPNAGGAVPRDLWQAALDTLETRFPRPTYELWIKPLQAISLDGNELLLSVPHKFAREWIENRLKPTLSDGIADAFGVPLDLRITVADLPTAPPSPVPVNATQFAPASVSARIEPTLAKPAVLNPRYTFQEFVTGNGSRFAHAAAIAVASAPARAYNPLFLHGGVGLGKTHLLHAIGNNVTAANPNARVEYVTSEQFTNAFLRAVERSTVAAFRERYRGTDVLLIDDIQFLAGRESTQEEFYHTFNALHESGAQIVMSSDRPPKEIATLEARLRSRFEWGLQADVQRPDLETREAILRRKAQPEEVAIPEDVFAFIARVIATNVRELEGALTRVIAYASLTNAPITLSLATDTLKDLCSAATMQRVTIPRIKETVAAAHGITVREMDNGRRDQRLAAPRQIAMYLATDLTNYSLPQIAREFGKRDHTTVMYARDKIKDCMTRDESYRNKIRQLVAVCQSGG